MSQPNFVVCINNAGYEASLELRKLYEAIPDESAAKRDQVRVVDESGEDYLYPASFFLAVPLPQSVVEQVSRAA